MLTSQTPPASASSTPERHRSRAAVIGQDTRITRALPHRARRTVGAWCFLDHLVPAPFAPGKGMHVGAHPHIGLQTFTWMIEGEVIHRDNLGNEQIIRPGQVNLMTAGRGIAHTEDSLHDGATIHAAQLWIALPAHEATREPAFANYPDLPQSQQGGFCTTLLAGSAFDQQSPASIYSPLVGIDFSANAAASARVPLRSDFEYATMVLRGQAQIAGEPLAPGEWLYFAPGRSELTIACDAAAQLLLLGGLPMTEEPLIWWNFVARSQTEIAHARADWNAGRFAPVRPGSSAAPLTAPSLEGVQLRGG